MQATKTELRAAANEQRAFIPAGPVTTATLVRAVLRPDIYVVKPCKIHFSLLASITGYKSTQSMNPVYSCKVKQIWPTEA
jgi:hypothetical protein